TTHFFLATDGTRQGLWATRGQAGDALFLGISLPPAGPRLTGPGQDLLYFVAADESHGSELWRSDGTPAGTYRVTDLNPGPAGSVIAEGGLRFFKGEVYFQADDGTRGRALWKTNGTPQGARLVKDVWPGTRFHEGPYLLQANSRHLFFDSLVPAGGWALWRTDGTARGTVELARLSSGALAYISDAALFGERLLFVVDDDAKGQELWTTDGTPGGTRLLRDLCPGPCSGVRSLDIASQAEGRVYFVGDDGRRGREPWSTDGTAAGTRIAADICPGTCGSDPAGFPAAGRRVLLSADDGVHGREVWSTTGRPQGTVRLTDSSAESIFSPEAYFSSGAVAGGTLFSIDDGVHGFELWRTNGFRAGTSLVADLAGAFPLSSYPGSFSRAGDRLYFFAQEDFRTRDRQLWRFDATGAALLRTFTPDEVGDWITVDAQGKLFLAAPLARDPALWRTDGTAAGTVRLTPEGARPSSRYDLKPAALGHRAFFAVEDEEHGDEVWTSDGTPEGTTLLADFQPGPSGSNPAGFTEFQGRVYFSTRVDAEHLVWKSDGTAAGTGVVKSFPLSSYLPAFFTEHAGALYFFADDGEHGFELWKTDGTEAGTSLVADLNPGEDGSGPAFLHSAGDRLYVVGGTNASALENNLWRSDGTAAGTQLLGPFVLGRSRLDPQPVSLGSRILAVGDTLWTSDGTATGTRTLRDREGRILPQPTTLAVLGGRAYFTTIEPGVPLYQTDGTDAGTFKLRDLAPRAQTSVWSLLPVGPRLFFPAEDEEAGLELWALEP
ncbi:MAG TPA: ELWxxDGT repeat protein, partial [Thermoanaerobaculia bacterium]|nr:ELWxxDGT repeat protein [Thermoanaerobaculia bacterium]